MIENNTMMITDDTGNEREVEILLTFENDDKTKKYVLFTDPTDEEEWEMCQEVLGSFISEDDGE